MGVESEKGARVVAIKGSDIAPPRLPSELMRLVSQREYAC